MPAELQQGDLFDDRPPVRRPPREQRVLRGRQLYERALRGVCVRCCESAEVLVSRGVEDVGMPLCRYVGSDVSEREVMRAIGRCLLLCRRCALQMVCRRRHKMLRTALKPSVDVVASAETTTGRGENDRARGSFALRVRANKCARVA